LSRRCCLRFGFATVGQDRITVTRIAARPDIAMADVGSAAPDTAVVRVTMRLPQFGQDSAFGATRIGQNFAAVFW
jgi:hypothetical protein